MERQRLQSLTIPCALLVGLGLAVPAAAVDWSAVPSSEIRIFHPGQSSYEWMLTERDHSGAPKIREGKDCQECHRGEEQKIGELIASGKKLEPTPGKVGAAWSPVTLQLAVDGDRFAARLQWPATGAGANKSDIALLFDDGGVNATTLTGCWSTCHADLPGMAHDTGLKLTKYLTQSRTKVTRDGGGDRYQPEARLAELVAKDLFLEYWQATVAAGAPAKAHDGWVLDKRHENDTPLVQAQGERSGGMWSVVLTRSLEPSGPHRKALVPGKTYTFGVAVHDGDAEGRFHRVSFENRFRIEGETVRLLQEGN